MHNCERTRVPHTSVSLKVTIVVVTKVMIKVMTKVMTVMTKVIIKVMTITMEIYGDAGNISIFVPNHLQRNYKRVGA